jgi:hypothetical protein
MIGRDSWRARALGFVAAVLVVAVSLLGAGSAAAEMAVSHYDTAAYTYDAPAQPSSPDTMTTYVRGSPLGPGAVSWGRSVSVRACGVAAKCEVGATAVDSAPAVGGVD